MGIVVSLDILMMLHKVGRYLLNVSTHLQKLLVLISLYSYIDVKIHGHDMNP